MRPVYAGRAACGFARDRPRQAPCVRAGQLDCGRSRPYQPCRRTARRAPGIEGASMATDVTVPALGEFDHRGTLAQWLKKPGEAGRGRRADRHARDRQGQRRRASPSAGVLSETLVNEGDTVAVGAVIARIDRECVRWCRCAAAPATRSCVPSAAGGRRDDQPRRSRREPATARRRACSRAAAPAEGDDHRSRRFRPRCAARCSSIMSIPARSGAPARTAA